MDRKVLASRLAEKDKNFVWLKRQLSPDQAGTVIALKIPGVFQQREFRRYYPAGDVTAHVIGFTGQEDQGQEGIELAQQSLLSGSPGQRRVIKDRKGRIVEDIENLKAPREGAESDRRERRAHHAGHHGVGRIRRRWRRRHRHTAVVESLPQPNELAGCEW